MIIEPLEARVLFSAAAPLAATLTQLPSPNQDLVMDSGGSRNRDISAGVIFPSATSASGPLAAVVGSALRGSLDITLQNQAAVQEKGLVVLNIYASDDGQFNSGDPLVATVNHQINLAAGASTHFTVTLKSVLPASLNVGTDTLILEALDPAGNVQVNLSGASFTYAKPIYALSESFGKAPPPSVVSSTKTAAAVQLQITDHGNSPLSGQDTIILSLSPDPASTTGTLVTTVKRNLSIGISKTAQITVPLQSIPRLSIGTYYFVVTVTDPLGQVTTAASSWATAVAAPFVSLSETFVATSLPSTIVGKVKTSAAATLVVTNSGNIAPSGRVTIDLYASANQSVSGAKLIDSVMRPLDVQSGGSVHVMVPLGRLPSVVPGEYYLVAKVIDSTGGASTAATASTLTVAAPVISFAPTLAPLTFSPEIVSGSKIADTAVLNITNNGNIASTRLTVDLLASTTGQLSGAKSFKIIKLSETIAPGATRSVKLPLADISSLANGTYFIVAEITDSSGGVSVATSSTSFTVAAPFIALAATIDSVSSPITSSEEGIVDFTVTNNGNIPTSEAAGGQLFKTVLDLLGQNGLPDSLGAADFTQKMSLAPGASKNLFAGFDPKTIPTPLQQGTYIPRMTISIEGTNYTTAVTGTTLPIVVTG